VPSDKLVKGKDLILYSGEVEMDRVEEKADRLPSLGDRPPS
jgi:hypothetical protein